MNIPRGSFNSQRGLTLVEMLVALAVLSIIVAVGFRIAVQSSQRLTRHLVDKDLKLEAMQVLRTIRTDIKSIGMSTYWPVLESERQTKFIYGDPWQVVFNADQDEELGPMKSDLDQDWIGSTNELYAPESDYTIFLADGTPLWTQGAETIRITLDRTGDGIVDDEDREDGYWSADEEDWLAAPGEELERFASANPADFLIVREVYGFDPNEDEEANLTDVRPIAFGMRGYVKSSDAYPKLDGEGEQTLPTPLFQYWGRWGGGTTESLWGDENADGELSAEEIREWLTSDEPQIVADPEDIGDDDLTLDDVLTRIVITVTIESPRPSSSRPNLLRSAYDGETLSVPYSYAEVQLQDTVELRNLQLAGENQPTN